MQQFSDECQMMLLWYAGFIESRQSIFLDLRSMTETSRSMTLSYVAEGKLLPLARGKLDDLLDAYSEDGMFEHLLGKAFVAFAYQMWEDFARPEIARALHVKVELVTSDLMGEWRRLRHWIMHPSDKTERAFFKEATLMATLLNLPRLKTPEITREMISALTLKLNSLRIEVNPDSQEPGLEMVPIPDEIKDKIIEDADSRRESIKFFDEIRVGMALHPSC